MDGCISYQSDHPVDATKDSKWKSNMHTLGLGSLLHGRVVTGRCSVNSDVIRNYY